MPRPALALDVPYTKPSQTLYFTHRSRFNTYIHRKKLHVSASKGHGINMFAVMVSDGHSIVDACNLAGRCTGFNPDVVRRWARAVFCDFLGAVSNIDYVDDQSLETELVSSKGRHPKWESLINDEGFVLEATAYVREHGYVKGAPNLTLADFVQWLKDKLCVEVCTEIARQ